MAGRRGSEHREAGPPTDAGEAQHIRAVLALGGVPWQDLEDGVQQVRLKLLESHTRSSHEEVRNPAAWRAVVASRVAADWHRKQARDTSLRHRVATRWARASTHPQEDRLLALAVAEGMEELTRLQRQALSLRFYADLPVRDIALLLEVPEGTIKSRLHQAVAAMRTRLRDMEVI